MNKQLVLTDFLDRAVRIYGNKEAIIDQNGNRYTYHAVNDRIQRLSYGLDALGIQKRDHVAYLAPNTLEMYEGFYGIFQTGAVMVSLNTRLTPNDYLYILNHSESKALFVDSDLLPLIEPILEDLETVSAIIVHGADDVKEPFIAYESWLESQPNQPFPRAFVYEDDVATLLYTSGTTGKPKGVMLTHRNNYLHALSTQHHLRVNDHDVQIHILPMFHVNGWGSPFYYTGNGCTQIMQKKIDPAEILEKVSTYKITVMHMAPTVLNSIITYYNQSNIKMTQHLRVVIAGSAPPRAFIKQIEENFGWEFYQVYGMTESSPLSLASYISSEDGEMAEEDYYQAKAKAGYEMFGASVRVVDDDDVDVPQDGETIGEVIVNGLGVMKGYWKNEQATKKTINSGWLHTGDMGTIEPSGRIAIVDRKKDLIISGGENISSIEVEDTLYEHDSVEEVAIIAAPHEKWGETPHAMVVLKDGETVEEAELLQFVRGKLAHFKCPTKVTFINELPKTGSGKIQKVKLRHMIGE